MKFNFVLKNIPIFLFTGVFSAYNKVVLSSLLYIYAFRNQTRGKNTEMFLLLFLNVYMNLLSIILVNMGSSVFIFNILTLFMAIFHVFSIYFVRRLIGGNFSVLFLFLIFVHTSFTILKFKFNKSVNLVYSLAGKSSYLFILLFRFFAVASCFTLSIIFDEIRWKNCFLAFYSLSCWTYLILEMFFNFFPDSIVYEIETNETTEDLEDVASSDYRAYGIYTISSLQTLMVLTLTYKKYKHAEFLVYYFTLDSIIKIATNKLKIHHFKAFYLSKILLSLLITALLLFKKDVSITLLLFICIYTQTTQQLIENSIETNSSLVYISDMIVNMIFYIFCLFTNYKEEFLAAIFYSPSII